MIGSTDQDILDEYDVIAQRCKEIEDGIYFYLKDRIHPSHLTNGTYRTVLNYLIKDRKGFKVTPLVIFTLNYSQRDYENGTIERDLENHNLPIDINDAYRQVEERLTREHLNWDQVVIDIEWKHIITFE